MKCAERIEIAHVLCGIRQKLYFRGMIQMYLKRKADAFLEAWKADQNRKPPIIKGIRQIGKTESILHFETGNELQHGTESR